MKVEEKKIPDQPFMGPLIDQAIENHTRMQSLLWKTNPIIIPVLNYRRLWAFQVVLVVKNLPTNAGDIRDADSIPGLGRCPGGRHGNPLQYSCLENPHGQRSLAGYSPQHHRVGHDSSDSAPVHNKQSKTRIHIFLDLQWGS